MSGNNSTSFSELSFYQIHYRVLSPLLMRRSQPYLLGVVYLFVSSLAISPLSLTLKVLVATIDALGHFEAG